jgi:hypothetical protein
MGEYNFNKDLKEGIKQEKKFIQFLKSRNKNIISYSHSITKEKDLTVEFDFGIRTFEIKSDDYSLDYPIHYRNITIEPDLYGTIFIEYECRGKQSGIMTTKADYWIHILKRMNEVWMIETRILREIVETHPFDVKDNVGDSDSMTKGFLIPREYFRKFFKIYKYE